jgi:competence protein ComEC
MQKSAPAGRLCSDGERWEVDGVRFEMLHPAPDDYARKLPTNAMSCVLKIKTASGSVLIPGDLEGTAEAEFLARHATDARADVLVAPHHGGRRTATPGFVEAVGAHEVIFSAGYRNRFGHPDPAVETRFRDSGAAIHRTDHDGAVTLFMGRDGIRAMHEREVRRRYWHNAGM